jgi:hypothetical protein
MLVGLPALRFTWSRFVSLSDSASLSGGAHQLLLAAPCAFLAAV